MTFKANNAPDKIYLQVGDIERDCEFSEVSIEDVTWHSERIFDTDIEYRRVKRPTASAPVAPTKEP